MLSFLETQQLTRNKNDSLATTFFKMTGENYIVYARFSIRNRKEIQNFIKSLDQDKQKQVDTFFICQELNFKEHKTQPIFFAVFTFLFGALESTKKTLEAIDSCEILQVTQLRVNELFQKMCQTSFIEINMFERLGKADFKVLRKTSNPFAEIYLCQDVSLFYNLEIAKLFISETLSQQKTIIQKMANRKPKTAYQRRYSSLLFGTITRDLIHISQSESQSLKKAQKQLKKYQIRQEQDFMRDESEQFQNVEYLDFDQNLQLQGEDRQVLMFVKKMRTDSIRAIRDKLKDADRRRQRQDLYC